MLLEATPMTQCNRSIQAYMPADMLANIASTCAGLGHNATVAMSITSSADRLSIATHSECVLKDRK